MRLGFAVRLGSFSELLPSQFAAHSTPAHQVVICLYGGCAALACAAPDSSPTPDFPPVHRPLPLVLRPDRPFALRAPVGIPSNRLMQSSLLSMVNPEASCLPPTSKHANMKTVKTSSSSKMGGVLAQVLTFTLALSLFILSGTDAWARGGGGGGSHSGSSSGAKGYSQPSGSTSHGASSSFGGSSHSQFGSHSSTYNYGGTHYKIGEFYNSTGYPKVDRSESAKKDFLRQNGYNNVPSGYQVDHIVPLFKGGSDRPSNMQLLTIPQHQSKTAREQLQSNQSSAFGSLQFLLGR